MRSSSSFCSCSITKRIRVDIRREDSRRRVHTASREYCIVIEHHIIRCESHHGLRRRVSSFKLEMLIQCIVEYRVSRRGSFFLKDSFVRSTFYLHIIALYWGFGEALLMSQTLQSTCYSIQTSKDTSHCLLAARQRWHKARSVSLKSGPSQSQRSEQKETVVIVISWAPHCTNMYSATDPYALFDRVGDNVDCVTMHGEEECSSFSIIIIIFFSRMRRVSFHPMARE